MYVVECVHIIKDVILIKGLPGNISHLNNTLKKFLLQRYEIYALILLKCYFRPSLKHFQIILCVTNYGSKEADFFLFDLGNVLQIRIIY